MVGIIGNDKTTLGYPKWILQIPNLKNTYTQSIELLWVHNSKNCFFKA